MSDGNPRFTAITAVQCRGIVSAPDEISNARGPPFSGFVKRYSGGHAAGVGEDLQEALSPHVLEHRYPQDRYVLGFPPEQAGASRHWIGAAEHEEDARTPRRAQADP
jgi:hypothetical protein